MSLRALTLIRPWPYAVCYLGKRLENRGWPPPDEVVGEWIALHAGAKYDREDAADITQMMRMGVPPWPVDQPVLPAQDAQPAKAIVAFVKVLGCTKAAQADPWRSDTEFAWVLDDEVRVLRDPVPVNGHEKLWYVPTVETKALREVWRLKAWTVQYPSQSGASLRRMPEYRLGWADVVAEEVVDGPAQPAVRHRDLQTQPQRDAYEFGRREAQDHLNKLAGGR